MNQGTIDVHCHFFNVSFAFEELLEIGWRWLRGNYPYKSDELVRVKGIVTLPREVQGIVEYVASFFAAAVRDPADNYAYEQQCYRESHWNSAEPLITAPLMMDIFFILDNGSARQHKARLEALSLVQRKAVLRPLDVADKDMPSFDEFAEEMKAQVVRAVSNKNAGKAIASMAMPASTLAIADELERVILGFKEGMLPVAAARALPSGGKVQMTRGYRKHLEALRLLRKKNPETVFPFLAVDPRRIGIKKLVRDQIITGGFRGVKLYSPLGYLPSHPALNPVFKLCVQHRIPVTTHTSPGGLPSMCDRIVTSSRNKEGVVLPIVFDKKKFLAEHTIKKGESVHSLFFADPDGWLDVLQSNGLGTLRVNFAHFGGQENILAYANGDASASNWTGKIIRLMERFEQVYADISFCPDCDMLLAIDKIFAKHPVVNDRLMFGTDFVMIAMHQCGLQNYFNHYAGISEKMARINPQAFLA